MCTCLAFYGDKFLFGRNMDVEYSFGERVAFVPRSFALRFGAEKQQTAHYAMLGTAAGDPDFPLFAEAVNEKGLCAAGLNFPKSAHYAESRAGGVHNVAPHEFIAWLLGQCESVSQAQALLENTRIVGERYKELPAAPLHWMIADSSRCIVAEPRRDGLKIYRNDACVLANEPPFPYHLANLGNYAGLSAQPPQSKFGALSVQADWQGAGAHGLPGDAGSPSRFVRAAFLLHNAGREEGVAHFFHLLSGVEMVRGSVLTKEGKPDYTRYACCIDAAAGKYYLRAYDSLSVREFSFAEEEDGQIRFYEH